MKIEEHPNIYVRFFIKNRIVKERSGLWTYERMIKKTREEFKNKRKKRNNNV
jgi:hypothetical protein